MTESLGNVSYNPLGFFQELHNKWIRFLETGWACLCIACENVRDAYSMWLDRVLCVSAGQYPLLLCFSVVWKPKAAVT